MTNVLLLSKNQSGSSFKIIIYRFLRASYPIPLEQDLMKFKWAHTFGFMQNLLIIYAKILLLTILSLSSLILYFG